MRKSRLKIYKELAKSGIVALVLISVLGGYLIGHPFETPLSLWHLLLTLVGVLLLASGSSALNQLQEHTIDAQMPRTALRPIPSGRITSREALVFCLLSLVVGLIMLWAVSPTVAGLGCLAVVLYNGLYTLWWKRRWSFAAVPGAVPGALPILMGYAASSGQVITPGGLYLFFILFYWQMPHFWALAIRYTKDYAQGGIPTLPVTHGSGITVKHIVLWCLAYIALALLAPLFLQVLWVYMVIAGLISAKLLWELWAFARQPESKGWLKFFLWINFSLIGYIAAAAADLWSVYLLIPYLTK